MQLTRRAAITATVLAAAGCHSKPKPPPSKPAAPPDIAALRTAGHIEEVLLAKYDAEIRRTPKHRRGALQVERAIHATHLAALQALAAPAAVAVTAPGSTTSLLRSSAAELRRFALDATDGAHAALLASIAASHAAAPQ